MSSLPIWLLPYRARRWLIQRVVNYCVKRGQAKWIHLGGQLYLERYILRGGLKQDGTRTNIYLHRFHRPDDDRGPHNHPWRWSGSLILTGGYVESRVEHADEFPQIEEFGRFGRRTRHRGSLRSRIFVAGDINRIESADEFHRVAMLLDAKNPLSLGGRDPFEPEVWTLFVAGPKHGSSWGYLIDWVFEPKRSCGGCKGCAYGALTCKEENVGTDEAPIYLDWRHYERPQKTV